MTHPLRNVAEIVKEYKVPLDPAMKLAHQLLFSNLAHLETIAVEAALRGDGIPNQLEDEHFHRAVFSACALKAGGLVDPDKPTADLINYLKQLHGETSIHILNIVAEGWLEVVFSALMEVPDLMPRVFALIAEDEKRHSFHARHTPFQATDAEKAIVEDLQEMLYRIANSAHFMLPLVRVLGRERASYMGHDLACAHEVSCRYMGIEPKVSRIKALARNGRLLLKKEPLPVEDRPWDVIKKRLWSTAPQAAQHAFIDIVVPSHVQATPVMVQSRLIRVLGTVYRKHPECMRVYRNGVTYEPQEVVLGLRIAHKDRAQVGTIFFNPRRYQTDEKLIKMLARRKRRMNKGEYEEYPDVRHLEPLLYPSFCVATVSSNGAYGGDFGFGPMNDLEGIGTAFTIGKLRQRLGVKADIFGSHPVETFFTLCVSMDHRIGDGKDIGALADSCKRLFEWTSLP